MNRKSGRNDKSDAEDDSQDEIPIIVEEGGLVKVAEVSEETRRRWEEANRDDIEYLKQKSRSGQS